MSARPTLKIDDPLAPGPPAALAPVPAAKPAAPREPSPAAAGQEAATKTRPARPPRATPPKTARAPSATPVSDAWREWEGGDRPATFRLPSGLIEELDERARALRLNKGEAVAAGLLTLFDLPDDELLALMRRVEDARYRARQADRDRLRT